MKLREIKKSWLVDLTSHQQSQSIMVGCFVLFYGISTLFGSFDAELSHLIKVLDNLV